MLNRGAGIRGGGAEDRERGRVANVSEVAHIEQTLAGIPGLDDFVASALPLQFLPTPEDYVGHYVQLASRGNAAPTTGVVVSTDGGFGVRGVSR